MQTTQVTPDKEIINFGIGQPGMSILPVDILQEAAAHRLAYRDPDILNYGHEPGDDYFREALATFLHQRYETKVERSDLFVTNGASQGLDFICLHYTKPEDTVIVDEATYFLSFQIFADHGLNLVSVPSDEHGMMIDALEETVRKYRPTLLYTIPTYHNPTTLTLPAVRRQKLVQLSHQYNFYIIADEVYHLLNYSETVPPPMASYDEYGRVFSLGSFSKILAPGLRVGWIQTKPTYITQMAQAGFVYSGGSLNHFTSKIVESALTLGLQDRYLQTLSQVYQHRIDLMDSLLREQLPSEINWHKPAGGFFFWLTLPEEVDAAVLKKEASAYGVGFHAGEQFTIGNRLKNKIRLSFAYYEDDEIREGVSRLARLCHDKLE